MLTNTALSGITGMMKWDQSDQSLQIRVTQRRGLEKLILSESFGSHWTSKVKINAYYKTIKVFFDLACMSACCWGLQKPKHEPFITHNRGNLNVSILKFHIVKHPPITSVFFTTNKIYMYYSILVIWRPLPIQHLHFKNLTWLAVQVRILLIGLHFYLFQK